VFGELALRAGGGMMVFAGGPLQGFRPLRFVNFAYGRRGGGDD